MSREVWRRCVENSNYEVSNLGRVRSARGVLRPSASASGHLSVVLGRSVGTKQVHQLVMSAFVGPRPKGMEVLHLDHDPSNNARVNLKYGTRSENLSMDYDAGRRSQAKPVDVIYPDGTTVRFRSICEAAKNIGISQPAATRCAQVGGTTRKEKVRISYVD